MSAHPALGATPFSTRPACKSARAGTIQTGTYATPALFSAKHAHLLTCNSLAIVAGTTLIYTLTAVWRPARMIPKYLDNTAHPTTVPPSTTALSAQGTDACNAAAFTLSVRSLIAVLSKQLPTRSWQLYHKYQCLFPSLLLS